MNSSLHPLSSAPSGSARHQAERTPALIRGAAVPAGAPVAAAVRLRIGAVQAAFRTFPVQRTTMLTPSDGLVVVLLPIRGGVVAVTADDTREAREGEALLLARPENVSCVWHAESAGLVLHLPRTAIQTEAARLLGEARRLAPSVSVFDWSDRPAVLDGPPFDPGISETDAVGAQANERQRAICGSLVEAIIHAGLEKSAFPVAKSVMRAIAHVRAHPQTAWTVEDLAAVAGVTAATLRRNFRACLGMTVSQMVREARLQWVHAQLASVHESRSISRLAEATGFGSASLLARAYQQCFGEAPSQTRARAFAADG